MLFDWTQAGPTIVAAFLASTVEFIEALTVVLAVGTVRGWRGTLLGGGVAVGVLLLVVALLGTALTRIPLDAIRVVVGTLVLLFGCAGCTRRYCVVPASSPGMMRRQFTLASGKRCGACPTTPAAGTSWLLFWPSKA